MTDTARYRTSDLRVAQSGRCYNAVLSPKGWSTRTVSVGWRKWTWDSVCSLYPSYVEDHTFDSLSWYTYRGRASGTQYTSNGSVYRILESYPVDVEVAPGDVRTKYGLGLDKAVSYAWELAARTNPSVPHVNLPAFVGEQYESLAQLPVLIKSNLDLVRRHYQLWREEISRRNRTLGFPLRKIDQVMLTEDASWVVLNDLIRAVPSANLGWWFCLKPLLSDIRKLLDFTDAVSRRLKWMDELVERRYLKRKAHLDRSVDSDYDSLKTLLSTQGVLRADRWVDYQLKVWGTMRWNLTADTNIPSDLTERKLFASWWTYGLNLHGILAAAWELTPWSWLVDWFAHVGTYLGATNNAVHLRPSRLCVMMRAESSARYQHRTDLSSSWITDFSHPMERETRKLRYVVPADVLNLFPPPTLPLLTKRQWSILGSLFIVKSKGNLQLPSWWLAHG